jgi:virulence-associated protein VagC
MSTLARIERRGPHQLIKLPDGAVFPGDHVRITPVGRGLLLEPVHTDVRAWFAALDRHRVAAFPEREQPAMPDGPSLD